MLQALLGQLFGLEKPAVPRPLVPTRLKQLKPSKPSGPPPPLPAEPQRVYRHSDFKGVHWSHKNQVWRAILLVDDKVRP